MHKDFSHKYFICLKRLKNIHKRIHNNYGPEQGYDHFNNNFNHITVDWTRIKVYKKKMLYVNEIDYTRSHNSDRRLCRTTDLFYKDHIFVY